MNVIKLRMVLPNKVKEFNTKLRAKELDLYNSSDLTQFTTAKPVEPRYITDKTIDYQVRSKERTDEKQRKRDKFYKGEMNFENEIGKEYVSKYTRKYNIKAHELTSAFDFDKCGIGLEGADANLETLTNFNVADAKNNQAPDVLPRVQKS